MHWKRVGIQSTEASIRVVFISKCSLFIALFVTMITMIAREVVRCLKTYDVTLSFEIVIYPSYQSLKILRCLRKSSLLNVIWKAFCNELHSHGSDPRVAELDRKLAFNGAAEIFADHFRRHPHRCQILKASECQDDPLQKQKQK